MADFEDAACMQERAENDWLNGVHVADPILGDMELIERPRTGSGNNMRSFRRGLSFQSDQHSDEEDTPIRLFRDPNLVDMPNLTSNSKVAVPVSVSLGNHSFDSNNQGHPWGSRSRAV
jgi:hypothetical protein